MGRRIAIFAAAVGCAATLGAGLPGAAASWVIQPTPNVANVDDNELVSVSCPGTTCVAVGDYTLKSRNDRPLVETWSGTQWSLQSIPAPPGSSSLSGVSCAAPDACAAVGNTILPGDAGTLTTLAEHR
jgi:hypothetical protein